jgi:hypothetical protein
MKAKKQKAVVETQISIPKADLRSAEVTLVGTSPLLVNRFDEKSKREIEEKLSKKAKVKREFDTPEQQYLASLYPIAGKKNLYGMPASGVKNCAVSACRFVDGISMTVATGAFHVVGDVGGLIPIKSPGPTIDSRYVKVGTFGNKKPCNRHRGRFDKWEVSFLLKYNAGVISLEQILNLYEHAGFSVGLCEYRPEKKGNLGMFSVKRG